jgi:hypothetical protein
VHGRFLQRTLSTPRYWSVEGFFFASGRLLSPAAIIAETWPAWLSACSHSTVLDLKAISHAQGADTTTWPFTPPGKLCQYDPSFWTSQPEDTIFLISGSVQFVDQVLQDKHGHSDYIASLHLGGKPSSDLLRRGRYFDLEHVKYGGGTSGSWSFGSNLLLLNKPEESPSLLRLGHLLNDTEGGQPTRPLLILRLVLIWSPTCLTPKYFILAG